MADIRIELGKRDDAFFVRNAVFVEEQGYDNEYDAVDDAPTCIHLTAYVDGVLVGCARTFPLATERAVVEHAHAVPSCEFDEGATGESTYLLGRVAVLPAFRRAGLAGTLVTAAERAAQEAGALVMKLHSQEYVSGLYAKLGYTQISDVDYEDEGQPHVWMAKRL